MSVIFLSKYIVGIHYKIYKKPIPGLKVYSASYLVNQYC